MSDEIRQNIDSYIYQENRLLVQLAEINKQKGNIGSQITKEAASLIAREFFGRPGGKVARSLVDRSEKERIQSLQDEVDRQHIIIVGRIRAYLGTVSEWKKNLKAPNSEMLISRLDRAQTGVRATTRIRSTIKLLTSMKSKRLVLNREIPLIEKTGIVLPPGSPVSGILELKKILSSTTNYVKICDPWVDQETLVVIRSVPKGVHIKLLTGESGKSKRFRKACIDFKVERTSYEMRVGEGLHDRFILTWNRGWLLGSSIKDFGKKFSAMISLPEKDVASTEKIFDSLWRKGQP